MTRQTKQLIIFAGAIWAYFGLWLYVLTPMAFEWLGK